MSQQTDFERLQKYAETIFKLTSKYKDTKGNENFDILSAHLATEDLIYFMKQYDRKYLERNGLSDHHDVSTHRTIY